MRISTTDLKKKMLAGEKLTMLTSYGYSMAKMLDNSGIDMILVGDSVGMIELGYSDTLPVTMDDMVHHTQCVVRGSEKAMVVADMPFLSYHITIEDAVYNAGRLIQEGGAGCVKLEGGQERVETVKAIINAQIPVMGHIGLTPQSVNQFGGFKVQGKDAATAQKAMDDAVALEKAGAFAIVLEGIPAALAKKITAALSIPTIGIGAGPDCDGQVLVVNDMLGMFPGHVPKFVKHFANLAPVIEQAMQDYKIEVQAGTFPAAEHCYQIDEEILKQIK